MGSSSRYKQLRGGRSQLVWGGLVATIVSGFFQLVIEFSLPNFFGVALAIVSWPIALLTFLSKAGFSRHPLPSVVVTGFWSTQVILPIIATALEWKPVTFNLVIPEQVFLHNAFIFITLVFAWEVHRRTYQGTDVARRSAQHYMGVLGIGYIPPPAFLLLAGIVGLSSMFYVSFYLPSMGVSAAGPLQKFVQGMVWMSYAPFLLFFGRLYGERADWRRYRLMLSVLAFILVFIALGRNSRAVFMNAVLFMGLAFMVGVMTGAYRRRLFSTKLFLTAIAGVILFTGPVADLATAMVLVRGERRNVDRADLVVLTLEAFWDKEALSAHRQKKDGASKSGWDERYVTNVFLSRFCNLKFADSSLELALGLSPEQRDSYLDFSLKRFFAIFPSPIVRVLDLPVDKDSISAYGWGDFLLYLRTSDPYVLGSFRVGRMSGTGIAALGYWYLFILGVSTYLVFNLLSLLSNANSKRQISALGLIYLSDIFNLVTNSSSVVDLMAYILRGWWEALFVYGMLWLCFCFVVRAKHFSHKTF